MSKMIGSSQINSNVGLTDAYCWRYSSAMFNEGATHMGFTKYRADDCVIEFAVIRVSLALLAIFAVALAVAL